MSQSTLLILYVSDTEASANFYQKVLNKKPVEAGPRFYVFDIGGEAFKLCLWSKADVLPPVDKHESCCHELTLTCASSEEIEQNHQNWLVAQGKVLKEPHLLHFGYSFVGVDLDGHRIRFLTQ